MISTLYRILTDLGSPFIGVYMRRRRAAGREDDERFAERFGHPSRPRPDGRLIWCHAVSVGEATSLLLLIEKLHDIYPDITVLLTTGTVTAARMLAPRLPSYAVHQYVPIDRASCVARFLKHWQPTLAVWIESELWPNTLAALRKNEIPTILLNARMSEKSFHNWQRVKGFARELMASFSMCLAQTEDDCARFSALGAEPVKRLGNLKYASAPLPFKQDDLALLRTQTAGRILWVMASTHRGEEQMAVAAHRKLAEKYSDLLTVIVPRHATRGLEIARLLAGSGLNVARRSKGEIIVAETQIYLADTMGELGLFYALCPIAVLGGSFVRIGGHNPIEPAQAGTAVVFGPYMYNFSEISREFLSIQAAVQLQHANEIAFAVEQALAKPEECDRRVQAARLLADQKRYILDQIIVEMEPWLKR
jgi:3-deoxy-D-manno-octulosonic-acid transferase